jgi:hypothetical protein
MVPAELEILRVQLSQTARDLGEAMAELQELVLPRFGGHLISGEPWFPEGVHCAEQLSAGVPPADGGVGAFGTDAGGTRQGVRALRSIDSYLGASSRYRSGPP